jgi:hypothetical protein
LEGLVFADWALKNAPFQGDEIHEIPEVAEKFWTHPSPAETKQTVDARGAAREVMKVIAVAQARLAFCQRVDPQTLDSSIERPKDRWPPERPRA